MANHFRDGKKKIFFKIKKDRFMDTLELANFAENLLGSQNKIIDLPYHPFYIKGNKL